MDITEAFLNATNGKLITNYIYPKKIFKYSGNGGFYRYEIINDTELKFECFVNTFSFIEITNHWFIVPNIYVI